MQSLRLEWINPADLSDNPANWRRHPQKQRSTLEILMKE